MWDAQTGQELLSLKGRAGFNPSLAFSLAFSPDGKRLASSDRLSNSAVPAVPSEIKVWDAQTGQEVFTLKGAAGVVAFSPDGKRLACVGRDYTPTGELTPVEIEKAWASQHLKIWDAQTGQELLSFKGHPGPVSVLAFSPDGKRLVSASSRNDPVKVWDAQTGQELLSVQSRKGGPLAFSPDGKRLARGFQVWDAESGRELLLLKGHAAWVKDVAFSPDGKRLATAWADKTVKVWDAETGQQLLTVPGGGGLAFSSDGHQLASSTEGGAVTIYDATPLPEKP